MDNIDTKIDNIPKLRDEPDEFVSRIQVTNGIAESLLSLSPKVYLLMLIPPKEDNLGGVKLKIDPNNIIQINPETGEIFASAGGIDFPISISQGGTGKTTKAEALLALLPNIIDQNGKVLGVVDGTIAWVDKGGEAKNIVFGSGLQESEPDPETHVITVSTKADVTQFTYDENGATILTAGVRQDLAKGASSVQSVNSKTPDAEGNINIITNPYVQGNGIDISAINPETGLLTISSKVNAGEFRYNDNGVIELSDQVTNALEKASTSVQTVNQIPADADGNVDVAGSLPVLTLVSDFVGEISVLRDWLLTQPNQQSILYIKTQTLPNIQIIITANSFTDSWEHLATYIKAQVRALYDGCPNFTCVYRASDGELELSTNDILNPIQMYIPIVPDNESLNVQMKLVPPGAVIVSQPYATIDQVNTIVDNAIIPIQQDIQLLNIDMFFADYYLGISINYLLSGKWDGDETLTYNEILAQLNDTNTLTFTMADDAGQFDYPLTITKQQFIDFATLDDFRYYISAQMLAQYEINNFVVIFKELGSQGFLISNLDSKKGILVCDDTNNNLAV